MMRSWKQYRLQALFVCVFFVALLVWAVSLLIFTEPTQVIYIRLDDGEVVPIENGSAITCGGRSIGRVISAEKRGPQLWFITAEVLSHRLRQYHQFFYVVPSNGTPGYFTVEIKRDLSANLVQWQFNQIPWLMQR